MSKDKFWIAFSSIEQIDSVFTRQLYNYFGDIEKAFNSSISELSEIDGLNIKKAENFIKYRDKTDIDKVFNEIEKRNINFITYEDVNYPYLLKQISDPPIVIYYKGNLEICNMERTLAVVGSRRASSAGKDVLTKILSEFAGTDICIVSGLAHGIDTTAHKAALDNNLKTIGVIAGGLDFVYPTSNKALYEKIENGYGAVITEYYPTFQPLQFRFPQRNRIVTGLSYGTLVAEAAMKSGALISANLCLEQGRELMCIPGLISNPNTEGIYKLLKSGAAMVTCGEDILNALNWEIRNQKQLSLDFCEKLSDAEQRIISVIDIEPKNFDMIQTETKIKSAELLVFLTNLELSGIIKQIEGEKYTVA